MSLPSYSPHAVAADEHDDGPGLFPPVGWLRAYRPAWLAEDLVAGITLAAYAIPVSLAYAGLAGLPPEVGIYGYLLGGLGYALFGSSRHLAVGPTSAISLMVGGTVGQMAGGDALRYAQIASLAGFVLAFLCVVAWALKLSSLTSFISETNLLGFKAGAALSIASTQLAPLLGVAGGGHGFFERVATVASQRGEASPVAIGVGLTAIALLLVGGAMLPGRPVALVVVALALVAMATTPLGGAGLEVVGHVPSGLPALSLAPRIRLRDVDGILPLAFGCLLLAYIEGVSAARSFADKHGYAIDTRQELLGLGASNLLVACGGGYPVAGGLSQSAVNESVGAKTPLALVFASATLALCLLFLAGVVEPLPRTVLAAIVLVAVKGLIDFPAIVRLWRVSRYELYVALLALTGVLVFGILKGILLAAVASILMLLRRVALPRVTRLGRLPGTDVFAAAERHPEAEPVDGALIVRVEASLLYFNVDHVQRAILDEVRRERGVRLVVWDLSSSPHVDLAAARMLAHLSAELAERGIVLRLAEPSTEVRRLLHADGAADVVRQCGLGALADLVADLARDGGVRVAAPAGLAR